MLKNLTLLVTERIGGFGAHGRGPASDSDRIITAPEVTELLVSCLSCGEQWLYAPPPTVLAGLLMLVFRTWSPVARCPECHSDAVMFRHSSSR